MENKTARSSNSRQNAMKEEPLHKFFMDALKDMYWAEKHLVDALFKLQEAATTDELKDAFEDHALLTRKHVRRLEKVFRSLDETPVEKKCEAMAGILKESDTIIKETETGSMTRDAALIIAAQKAEHYEIASYGGLVALAKTMQHDTAAELLENTLEEEEETDRLLTDIAEVYINFEAAFDEKNS